MVGGVNPKKGESLPELKRKKSKLDDQQVITIRKMNRLADEKAKRQQTIDLLELMIEEKEAKKKSKTEARLVKKLIKDK